MAIDKSSDVWYCRATEDFPAGEECELTCDDVPDDEEAFGWTEHYEKDSRNRTDPDVTDDVIETLLTDSTVRRAEQWDDRYLFQTELDGVEWTLVVADDGEAAPCRWILITIYSNWHGSVGTTNRYLKRKRKQMRGDD